MFGWGERYYNSPQFTPEIDVVKRLNKPEI
jgi:hypothetical protein